MNHEQDEQDDPEDADELDYIPLPRWQKALTERPPQPIGSLTCDGITIEGVFGCDQKVWFEYHCWESHDSSDADLWYHSHQEVVVLGFAECDPPVFAAPHVRAYFGHPLVYRIRFADGFISDATEDELMLDKNEFVRPDPPDPIGK